MASALGMVRVLVSELHWRQRLCLQSQMIFWLLSPEEVALMEEHFKIGHLLKEGKTSQALGVLLEDLKRGHLQHATSGFARLGMLGDLQELFNQGCNVGCKEDALMATCRQGYLEVAQLLVSRMRLLSFETLDEALRLAVRKGHLEVMQFLRRSGARDVDGAFYQACRGGHFEAAQLLISWGAANFDHGLLGAARGGHLEMCRWLLDRGANPMGHPLQYAAFKGHLVVVRLLLAGSGSYQGNNRIAIVKAATAMAANLDVLLEILTKFPVDNYQQMMDNAVSRNQLPIVEFLLQYQPSFKYDYQRLASIAAEKDHPEMLIHILRLGPVDLDQILAELGTAKGQEMTRLLHQHGLRFSKTP